jgi:MFS family permease
MCSRAAALLTEENAVSGSHEGTVVDRRSARRATRASFAGTLLEFYDFTLYATAAATVFPSVFFPGASPLLAAAQSIATFSVAFLVRPFAGAFLGSLGDRIGRRRVLVFTLLVMGGATVGIGLIPGADAIGWLAPALLLLMRVLQGIGASAEFSGATLVAVEFAPKNRRGLLGSIPAAGNGIGGTLATLALLLVQTTLTSEQFLAWGWRIPFLLGGILVGYGLWLRIHLPETPEFRPLEVAGEVPHTPLRDTLRQRPRELLGVTLVVMARTGLAYFFLVFLVSFAANQAGLSRDTTLVGLLISYLALAAFNPLFGWLSDFVGRRTVIMGGFLLEVALAFPVFTWIGSDWPEGLWLAMFLGNGVGVAACTAPIGRLMAELFPVRQRFTGMGVANETGIAIGGAVVPPLAVYLAYLGGGATTSLSVLLLGLATAGLVGLLVVPRREGTRQAPTPPGPAAVAGNS